MNRLLNLQKRWAGRLTSRDGKLNYISKKITPEKKLAVEKFLSQPVEKVKTDGTKVSLKTLNELDNRKLSDAVNDGQKGMLGVMNPALKDVHDDINLVVDISDKGWIRGEDYGTLGRLGTLGMETDKFLEICTHLTERKRQFEILMWLKQFGNKVHQERFLNILNEKIIIKHEPTLENTIGDMEIAKHIFEQGEEVSIFVYLAFDIVGKEFLWNTVEVDQDNFTVKAFEKVKKSTAPKTDDIKFYSKQKFRQICLERYTDNRQELKSKLSDIQKILDQNYFHDLAVIYTDACNIFKAFDDMCETSKLWKIEDRPWYRTL